MPAQLASTYYPRVPIWRRGAALAIDFVAVGLVSLLLGQSPVALAFVYGVGWLGMRVVLVAKNHGQSLGRWALDMKVMDARFGGTPGLQELCKREGLLGFGSLLVLIGLINLTPSAPWAISLFLPLAIDCGFAYGDPEQQQTFHDQVGRTRLVQTRRGYSLDVKLRRLVAYAQRRMK
jgi:RDD family